MSEPDFFLPFACVPGWSNLSYPLHTPGAADWNFGSGTADLGKPVLASAAGRVHSIDPAFGHVRIQTANRRLSYAHMQHIRVHVGQTVALHEQIGEIGAVYPPPKVISPHLHMHVTDLSDRFVLLTIHGKRVPASTIPSRSGKFSVACAIPVPPPHPHPEEHMLLGSKDEAGALATLPAAAVIEDAGGHAIPGVVTGPNPYTALGRTPHGRIAIAVRVPGSDPPEWQEAYVQPDGVTLKPPSTPDCTEQVKALLATVIAPAQATVTAIQDAIAKAGG